MRVSGATMAIRVPMRFSFSAAFKRGHGVSPQQYRRARAGTER